MSDRTKFFKDKEKLAKAVSTADLREEEERKKATLAFDEVCADAAAVYAPHFDALVAELRNGSESIGATLSKDSKVIGATDAHTGERYEGNVFLTLHFRAGDTDYEMVHLVVRKPSDLGMLAWRRGNDPTYYVGPASRTSLAQVRALGEVAGQHVEAALDAMKAG